MAPNKPSRTPLDQRIRNLRAREARLAAEREAAAERAERKREAIAHAVEAEFAPDWLGSLDPHRSRWLASLASQTSPPDAAPATGVPLSRFSLAVLFGEPLSRLDALDCATGIAWWTSLRFEQYARRADRARGTARLFRDRIGFLEASQPPIGVKPALWRTLVAAAESFAHAWGWLEDPKDLSAFVARFDPGSAPAGLDLSSPPALGRLRAADRASFDRGASALLARLHEAELISGRVATRAADRFGGRVDEDLLARHGFVRRAGAPNVLPRRLALWILRRAGASVRAASHFLLHAGLLDSTRFELERSRVNQKWFEELAADARKFWQRLAKRENPVTPETLIGNLEEGAWRAHHGRVHANRLAALLTQNPPTQPRVAG